MQFEQVKNGYFFLGGGELFYAFLQKLKKGYELLLFPAKNETLRFCSKNLPIISGTFSDVKVTNRPFSKKINFSNENLLMIRIFFVQNSNDL